MSRKARAKSRDGARMQSEARTMPQDAGMPPSVVGKRPGDEGMMPARLEDSEEGRREPMEDVVILVLRERDGEIWAP